MSAATLAAIADIKAQLLKAKSEITTKIAALEDALANATSADDAAVLAALSDLKASAAQPLDDIVVDSIPVPSDGGVGTPNPEPGAPTAI